MSRAFPLPTFRTGMALLLATTLLAACDENGDFVAMQALEPKNTDVQGTPEVGAEIKTVERDIEAPDVFSATEAGLWDGRPSLGGVWVAHPDVNEPERVIIRNSTNDKFVVGALFRRERDIPGPRLQISSDAAEALGMLAGAPADLNVTALRKEEVAAAPEAGTPIEADTVATPGNIEATSLDPIASAAAALDVPASAVQPAAQSASAATSIQPAAQAAPIKTATATRPSASKLSKPYIQIGIFSVEANAERTAKQMRGAGVIPSVNRFERDGKPFWRVVVGPAATSGERTQLLTKIKGEGFTDAYAVTN